MSYWTDDNREDEAAAHAAAVARLQASDEALGAIHTICHDAGIPPGHVVERVRALADRSRWRSWPEAPSEPTFAVVLFGVSGAAQGLLHPGGVLQTSVGGDYHMVAGRRWTPLSEEP